MFKHTEELNILAKDESKIIINNAESTLEDNKLELESIDTESESITIPSIVVK